ncbi:hypothetical protein EDC01DRAFT_782143 [Geopyxis carbonaria]|nr:hypothetical protein EDC01DRAFT_782143 [Geopyxis carbonaria]
MSSSLPPNLPPPLTIHTTIASLRVHRRTLTLASKTVGFIPTMGALHSAHLSLVRAAAATCDSLVVSIFVNPAQFAPTEDLGTYPRTLTADVEALVALNAEFEVFGLRGRIEAVFVPTVAEMYPGGIPAQESAQRGAFVTVQPLASKLEGITRPHFFRGVATVCAKLFNIVQPDRAYFGQKDVQQSIVLRRMVRDLCVPLEIVVCETGREEDGLAMSSRNVYLGERRRAVAPVLYKALKAAAAVYDSVEGKTVKSADVVRAGREVLDAALGTDGVRWEVEYFSLADKEELEELEEVVDREQGAVLSAALKMLPTKEGEGPVRLIDNIILEGQTGV